MADETSQGLTTSIPMSTPPTPTAPAPPPGAMDKGVTGADPANDPSQSLMAEATRLGGPLGGIAIGAATGAAHHTESQQPSSPDLGAKMAQDPEFLALKNPNEKIQLLSGVDPQFKNLSPQEQFQIVSSLPSRTGFGAANLGNAEDIGTGPEGTIGTDQLMSQASQADASKKGGMLAGAMTGALVAPAAAAGATALAPAAISGLAGSVAAGGAVGGAQSITEQLAAGENPFRLQMLKQTAADTAMGAATGGVLHGVGKAIGGIANKYNRMFTPGETEAAGLPSEVTEQHFTPIPDEKLPVMADGKKPYISNQPFDRATIVNMPQGKNLDTDTIKLLQDYAGDTIEAGSHAKNTAMRAVVPMTENINRLGLELNKLVQDAPAFESSTLADPDVGTSLLEDLDKMKGKLAYGRSSEQTKIIDNAMTEANDALTSKDPQEILKARREMRANWTKNTSDLDSDQQVQNEARKRIYGALTDKLHQEIPGTQQIDQDYQPHLDLKDWFIKTLGKDTAYDPVVADQMRVDELRKGKTINAINAHNARVEQNSAVAKKALNRTATAAKIGAYAAGGGLIYEAGKHTSP